MPNRTAIVRETTPEETELVFRRRELAGVRELLAARERSLDHLRDQIFSFEARYIRQVGVLYRQLDEWEERLAELKISCETPEERALHTLDAQKQAIAAEIETIASSEETEPPPNLKALFRELAKRIHPDFAGDEHDELHRTRLMAQANEALRREDAAALQRMLNGHDPSLDLSNPAAVKAELKRVKKLLADLQRDIAAVDAEMHALAHSEMAQLRDATTAAALKGQDLLAELAARVKGRIGMAMRRYEMESSPNRRPTPAIDPDSLLSAEIPRR